MNEIVNNKVNLCDSCSQVYPDCTSQPENVYFGDGIGHDNICACSEYRPKTCGDGDTISRAVAVDALGEKPLVWDDFSDFDLGKATQWSDDVDAIKALPSAQPQRRKGKWIHDGYDIPHGVDWMHCSVCGRREPHVPAAMTNFCPNCGADMRQGEQE